jgi:hypothetical protein
MVQVRIHSAKSRDKYRWVRATIAALALTFGLSGPANAKVVIDPAPIVQVVCEDRRGSAVRIDHDTYISVAHVAEAKGCKIEGTPVEVFQLDSKDFVILKGPQGKVTASYSCRGFKRDAEYLAVGYGNGWPVLMYQPLRASGYKVIGQPYQMFTGEVIPGMSGGPVYDKRGKVIGVINRRWPARSLPLSETSLCKKGL